MTRSANDWPRHMGWAATCQAWQGPSVRMALMPPLARTQRPRGRDRPRTARPIRIRVRAFENSAPQLRQVARTLDFDARLGDSRASRGREGMRALSLEQANAIITATFAAAEKSKCRPMSAIILDAGGRVKAFQKQDGASMVRFEICYGKAYAAL